MKTTFLLLIFTFILSFPVKAQETSNDSMLVETSTTKVKKEKSNKKDGSSFKNAIVIKANNEIDGVNAEYEYLKNNFPGYKPTGQSLVQNGGKPYDVITLKNDKGEEKIVYFDISKFFGKL